MKNIDIFPENQNFESDYLPLISFKTKEQQAKVEKYILDKAKFFFKEIIKIEIDVKKSQIPYFKTITEKDFRQKEIKYFYDHILYDLGKRDQEGKLIIPVKWGVTFDEKCAPILISYLQETNYQTNKNNEPIFSSFNYHGIPFDRFGIIQIRGQPVFYYIYFTLQELLDVIKE